MAKNLHRRSCCSCNKLVEKVCFSDRCWNEGSSSRLCLECEYCSNQGKIVTVPPGTLGITTKLYVGKGALVTSVSPDPARSRGFNIGDLIVGIKFPIDSEGPTGLVHDIDGENIEWHLQVKFHLIPSTIEQR